MNEGLSKDYPRLNQSPF